MFTHLKPIEADSAHINSNTLAFPECIKRVSISDVVSLFTSILFGVAQGTIIHILDGLPSILPAIRLLNPIFPTTCGLTAVCTSRSRVDRWASQCLGPLVRWRLKDSKELLCVIIKKGNLSTFHQLLNPKLPGITFTMGSAAENKPPVLDILRYMYINTHRGRLKRKFTEWSQMVTLLYITIAASQPPLLIA